MTFTLGNRYSAAITENGDLYLWGWNENDRLGTETYGAGFSNIPIKVMSNVKKVSLGDSHSAAITEEGDLYLWGSNDNGCLGDGTGFGDCITPTKIMSNVKEVSLGNFHSAAITENGDLYLWGSNGNGELGNGTNVDSNIPIKIMSNVKKVSLGWSHSAAITEEGDLYLWGENAQGELGNGTNVDSNIPIKIMSNVKEVSLAAAEYSTAITEEGDLYLWGLIQASNVPIKIMSNVKKVSLGGTHSAAIIENGDLYLWGRNAWGNLGNGTTDDSNVPIRITISNYIEGHDNIAAMQLIADYNECSDTSKNWNGINFSNLLSNEVYNYYIMKDSSADTPFASSNLLYIGQALSDENGNLSVAFTEKEEYADAEIFAVPMYLADLSGAEVYVSDLTCNGKVQYATIAVTYQGTALVPGEDFYVEGEYGVTQEGEYSLKVVGTGLYSGEVTASYRVNPGEQTFGISGSICSFGDTVYSTMKLPKKSVRIPHLQQGNFPIKSGTY